MITLPVSLESIEKGAIIIKGGGLVAFPTETVYGLGADAYNPQAVAKIFEVKNRPRFDPLIIHIASIETLSDIVNLSSLNDDITKKLFTLAENFWPGPLSIILPKNEKIPGIVTAGLPSAAVRIPDNSAALKLISLSGGAVAAPSANPFGSLSPTRAEHVQSGLGEKADLILDGGPARIGIESTVIEITDRGIKILRPGGTPKEAIENLTGASIHGERSPVPARDITSPGQLKSHYAPDKPLYALTREEIINQPAGLNGDSGKSSAFLFFDGATRDAWYVTQNSQEAVIVKVLSENGNALEAASCLFEILRELDKSPAAKIYAQLAPPHGLGEAINDRLLRGSHQ